MTSINTKLSAAQRHELILTTVQNDGFVSVLTMAELCGVSEMTLRRDLEQLAEKQLLTRTHGGAISLDKLKGISVDLVEPSVNERSHVNHQAKQRIALKAMEYIKPEQTLALDIGTTTFELANLLHDMTLRIFTNSLKIADSLCPYRPAVYVPCGQVSGIEPSIIGAQAIENLRNFHFDIAFIGASGLTPKGIFDYSLEDASIKRVLIEQAQTTAVLLDSSKFEHLSVVCIAKLADIDILISDQHPPEWLSETLQDEGVEIVIAT